MLLHCTWSISHCYLLFFLIVFDTCFIFCCLPFFSLLNLVSFIVKHFGSTTVVLFKKNVPCLIWMILCIITGGKAVEKESPKLCSKNCAGLHWVTTMIGTPRYEIHHLKCFLHALAVRLKLNWISLDFHNVIVSISATV